MKCDSQASLLARTFASPCLGHKPKVRVATTMEQVRKEHYLACYKHLFVCDLALGFKFLQEIQTHYDNNSEPKMFTKKL
jgi:hypothetical protein